jgi:hypothetical protein
MNKKTLTDDEESKIDCFYPLLDFLNKDNAIFFIFSNTFRFEGATGSFHDQITGNVIAPSNLVINFFYSRLCDFALNKLRSETKKSDMVGIRRLLVRYHKLDFLPLGF